MNTMKMTMQIKRKFTMRSLPAAPSRARDPSGLLRDFKLDSPHESQLEAAREPPVAARAPSAGRDRGQRLPIRRDRRAHTRRGRSARPRLDALLRSDAAGL